MNIPHSQELRLECIKDVVGTIANDREHAANPIKVIYWSAVLKGILAMPAMAT